MKKSPLRRTVLGLAGVALVALAACEPVPEGPLPTTAPTTTTAPAPTWKVVGGDEFNDSTLDTTKWRAYNNTYGDGNGEMACLTPNNIKESNGSLKITAKKQAITCPGGVSRSYSSGFIGSREAGKYYPRYGRFEVRARLPHNQGLWPAFWLRHRNGAGAAETDVMEYFHSQAPGKTTGTIHLDGRDNLSKRTVPFESSSVATSGWHTWRTDILPVDGGVRFDFYLDGTKYHSYVDTQHKWDDSVDPNGTWDMAINLAVGGKWAGRPDGKLGVLEDLSRCSLGGTYPSACTTTGINRVDWADAADSTYEIDYVRVYQLSA